MGKHSNTHRLPEDTHGYPKAGEPVTYELDKPYWFQCCDCGCTHVYLFDIIEGKVEITSYRDDYTTDMNRKRVEEKEVDPGFDPERKP